MKPIHKKSAPFYSFIIGVIALIVVSINFIDAPWNHPKKVIAEDVISYYAYLPAFFIYHDLSFQFVDEDPEYYNQYFWLFDTPAGNKSVLTTMGLSFLYAPFFLSAHFIAPILGYENNGFSAPYKFALVFSSLAYVLLGLFFLSKVLRQFFDDKITGFTLLCIVPGTNLLYYTTSEAAMSHAYSFSLIAVFLYLVIRWYRMPGIKNSILLGALAGLITLIRPTNILVLLLFVFWETSSLKELAGRMNLLFRKYFLVVIMAIAFIAVWIPQFIYWYQVSGSVFYYSYEESGGNFFFGNPQIIPQLFSYRKGWLLYTPMMAMAILGLIISFKKYKTFALPITLYLLASIYVLSSWWSWWSGGSYGLRFYIDLYGVMALPLAAIISYFFDRKKVVRLAGLGVIGLLLIFSLFQTYQYHQGVIHFSGMNKQTYWKVFGKIERPPDFFQIIDRPNYDSARLGIYVNYPKLSAKKLTKDNCTEEMIIRIRHNKQWMLQIREKARKRNITEEEMIKIDAAWWCKKKFGKMPQVAE